MVRHCIWDSLGFSSARPGRLRFRSRALIAETLGGSHRRVTFAGDSGLVHLRSCLHWWGHWYTYDDAISSGRKSTSRVAPRHDCSEVVADSEHSHDSASLVSRQASPDGVEYAESSGVFAGLVWGRSGAGLNWRERRNLDQNPLNSDRSL